MIKAGVKRLTLQFTSRRNDEGYQEDDAECQAECRHDVITIPLSDTLPSYVRAMSFALVRDTLRSCGKSMSVGVWNGVAMLTGNGDERFLDFTCCDSEEVHA